MNGTQQSSPQDRVVVGYDGSDPGRLALDRAAHEAVRRDAELEILIGAPWGLPTVPETGGVRPPGTPPLDDDVQQGMDTAVRRVQKAAPGLRVVPTVTEVPAAEALLDATATAALTVVGTRGHGGFAGLLLGSVSLRVAAHAQGPFMAVRGTRTPAETARGTVLVGVQTGDDGDAVRFAFEEAVRRDAAVRLLHAWDYPAPMGGMPVVDAVYARELVETRRQAALAVPHAAAALCRAEFPDVRVITDEEVGSVGRILVDASDSADVLVVAARRNPHRFGMQLGPVNHAVLHHARCPVVLIPHG